MACDYAWAGWFMRRRTWLLASSDEQYDRRTLPAQHDAFRIAAPTFFADRLKVQQREAGVRHDLIDAVFALGGEDDLVRLLARVHALQAFIATEDGANLLAGYKRAANILKKEEWLGIEGEIAQTGEEDPLAEVDDPDLKAVVAAKMAERHKKALSYTPEPAEKALDRCARYGRAQGRSGDRGGGFRRGDGRAGIAARHRSTAFSTR